jgi:uncharacterized protein (TIGR03437 family)
VLRHSSYLALLAAALQGQDYPFPFQQVAVTDDAQQIYVWSRVPLKAHEPLPSNSSALYQISTDGIQKVAIDQTQPLLGYQTGSRSNLHVTGGGTTLVWTWAISNYCNGGSSCMIQPRPPGPFYASYILRAGMEQPQRIEGPAQISRNGRFLLQPVAGTTTLHDLEAGMQWMVPVAPVWPGHAVTSDGRVLGAASPAGPMVLWSPSQRDTVQLPPYTSSAEISDDGRVVIYGEARGSIVRLAVGGSATREILGPGLEPSLSTKGDVVVFRRDGECFLVRSGSAVPLNLSGGRAVACAISGLGNTAVVLTEDGRILKFNTSDLAMTEVVPPTPYGMLSYAVTPGGIITWRGQGAVRVLLNGEPLPILRDQSGEVWFQVPLDLPVGSRAIVQVDTPSPFAEPPRHVTVALRSPYFFSGSGGLVAAHADFRGLVTIQDPAEPGEIIHLWAVGLGPVSGTRLEGPFDCRVPRGENLNVLYAGLAPGMPGIYQVDVQLPRTVTDTFVSLSCGTTGEEAQRHGGWVQMRAR